MEEMAGGIGLGALEGPVFFERSSVIEKLVTFDWC